MYDKMLIGDDDDGEGCDGNVYAADDCQWCSCDEGDDGGCNDDEGGDGNDDDTDDDDDDDGGGNGRGSSRQKAVIFMFTCSPSKV